MADIEKVIKALDCLATNESTLLCSECAYYRYSTKEHPGFCNFTQAMRDAISLLKEQEAAYQGAAELLRQKTILFDDAIKRLKEQEAVKPKLSMSGLWYECPVCNRHLTKNSDNYCARCGRPVLWEGR